MTNVVGKILGGQVNSLCNVLTLDVRLHQFFDQFMFWFEEVSGQVSILFPPPFPYSRTAAEYV
jgi:hypothetical protein